MKSASFLSASPLGFHRVAYSEWGAATDYPPAICVHGLTRNGRDFDDLARALQAERHVICPDIVGRGSSDWFSDPSFYTYPQYLTDMVTLIARITKDGADKIDWVGTSMGGLIGMFLAASTQTPIRRLVINDIGPLVPLTGLKRIGSYVAETPEFPDISALEHYIRKIYAGFGKLSDTQWHHLAVHSARRLPNGKWAQAYDPAIAQNFRTVQSDLDFWGIYDRITCPVLVLRGVNSDILSAETAQAMTQRGPKARLVEFADTGHAPALMASEQIAVIAEFLKG